MTNTKDEKEIEFKIPIDQLYTKFIEHLEIENNSRILFSGKFGIGKTYFLKKFFEEKKDKYEVFHLFPINYQISSNKDIIEYLKYDISVELYQKDKNIYKKNDYLNFIDMQSLLYLWGKDNITEILKTSVSFIPELGKPLKDTIGLVKNFWGFKKDLESNEIDDFVNKIKERNISETDYLSELLKEKIKEVKGDKQSILIIDDLDRIDPEHIFRILNIFSAHFDLQNNEFSNKFGFDKIILVADYLNIKSIFHYKYGIETDFNGYFDKFFSVEVFQFRNEEIIKEYVDIIISEFKKEKNNILSNTLSSGGYLRFFLKEIFIQSSKLSGKEQLSLRQLLKGVKLSLPTLNTGAFRNLAYRETSANFIFTINISIKTLIAIFGGMDVEFLSLLKKIRISLKQDTIDIEGNYETFSLFFLNKFVIVKSNNDNLKLGWENYSISISDNSIGKIVKKDNQEEINIVFLFYDLLIEYIKRNYYLQNN